MKNLKIYKIILSLFVAVSFVACDKGGEPDPGATKLVMMAGDWYVQASIDGTLLSDDYYLISTYNGSADDGTEIWIDDLHNFWDFKVKSPVNSTAMTFSGDGLTSVVEDYNIQVTISNGAIVKNGATSTGGNTVDGISLDAEFSDDPGTIYHLEGYKRTGLLEDNH